MCVGAHAQAFSTNSLHKENILKNTLFDQKVLQEKLYTSISSCISLWSVKVLVAQLCLTLCDPMDCNLPGSSVHGILQASILKCVALLQEIFPTQGSNLHHLLLLHWQAGSLPLVPPTKPVRLLGNQFTLLSFSFCILKWSGILTFCEP